MPQSIPSQIPIVVESFTFMENVSSCFDGIKSTEAGKILHRKESWSIFSYWRVIGNSS